MNEQSSQESEHEFAELLKEAQTRLYCYVHMLVQDINDADDVFQQTSLILWRKFKEYDRKKSFFSWACGIARYEAFNMLRKRQRQVVKLSDQVDVLLVDSMSRVSSLEYEQRREALKSCIQQLNDSDQSLLQEHYAHSKSVRHIAERLKRKPQSVHNSLQRIRVALFQCIKSTLVQKSYL